MSKSSPPTAEHQMLKKLQLCRAWPGKKALEFINSKRKSTYLLHRIVHLVMARAEHRLGDYTIQQQKNY